MASSSSSSAAPTVTGPCSWSKGVKVARAFCDFNDDIIGLGMSRDGTMIVAYSQTRICIYDVNDSGSGTGDSGSSGAPAAAALSSSASASSSDAASSSEGNEAAGGSSGSTHCVSSYLGAAAARGSGMYLTLKCVEFSRRILPCITISPSPQLI